MGTSKSYGGPVGHSQLLPNIPDPFSEPPDTDSETDDSLVDEQQSEQVRVHQPQPWRTPKTLMTRYVNSGDRRNLQRAGSSYVGARGGGRPSAHAAVSGRAATSGLAGFLASVVSSGVEPTFRQMGFRNLIGKPVDEVISVICDIIAPQGDTLETAAARAATADVMGYLLERYSLLDNGIENLDSMDEAGICDAILYSVRSYIYERWLQELGNRIEKNATTPEEAVHLEREIYNYVHSQIELQFENIEPLSLDWNSHEAQAIVEDIYRTAYECLEVE